MDFRLTDEQQQIQQMVRDLNVPVELDFAPTVREPDGLALSSRNVYLSPEERAQAPVLYRALLAAEERFRAGEIKAADLRTAILNAIAAAPLARVDYVEVVDAASLSAVEEVRPGCVMALAVFFGKTRLIDNRWLT